MKRVFGNDLPNIARNIAKTTGLRAESVDAVLSSAAPLVLNALGRQFAANNLNTSTLSSVLMAEVPRLRGSIPAVTADSPVASPEPSEIIYESTNRIWLLLPLLLVLGAAAWWILGRGGEDAPPDATKTTVITPAATVAKSTNNTPLGEFIKRKLPDNVELSIPRLGVENRLLDFIESSKPVDKTIWFDFDRLLFETGKSTLSPASEEQLINVTQILKAYPNLNLKIGGYTDNEGSKTANYALSQERADSVVYQFVALGIDKARLTAEGYGEEHPLASNDFEEGRARNRRVSIRVTQK